MGATRRSAFGLIVRIFSLFLVSFCVLVGWRIMTSSRIAEAATDTYYPSFCLGGWDKPRHASGPVETGNGGDPNAFTLDNSAFLASDISSQIFCGYFPIEHRDNPPASAEIRLVWNFVGAHEPATPPAVPAPEASTSTSSEESISPTQTEVSTTTAPATSPAEQTPASPDDSATDAPAATPPAASPPAPDVSPTPLAPADTAPTSLT
jgi:hypothetical protein